MGDRKILMVEDDGDDENLLWAMRKNDIANPVVVAHDGAEALEFRVGAKVGESDLIQGPFPGPNSDIHKPVDFPKFVDAVSQIGLYWLVLNEVPPVAAHS